MNDYVLFINGGTTNTRFILLKGGNVIAQAKRFVGAATAKENKRNPELEEAVRKTISEMEAAHECRITNVVASGMLTSNVGLMEIHHLEAPVTFEKLIAAVKPYVLESISQDITFYMIPGIKFRTESENLQDKDLMRGEETEILGALSKDEEEDTTVFVHLGSHGKAILFEGGAIVKSVTTFGGEMLWTACHNTILQSSVSDLNDMEVDEANVLEGFAVCMEKGLTRALFLGRIASIEESRSPAQVTSFIIGAMTCSDMQAFLPIMEKADKKIIVYGRDSYIQAMKICVDKYYLKLKDKVRLIDFYQSESLAIEGMHRIYNELNK